ncbi:MAG: hypothetical protein IKS60_06900 [Lachnospiraceae bacterium]|nr:hypothetical protein [Lachnospiraceae bacterium]
MDREKSYFFKLKNISTQRKIIICVLSYLFSIFAVFGIQFDKYSRYNFSYVYFFVLFVLFALHLVILYVVYSHLDDISELVKGKEKEAMEEAMKAAEKARAEGKVLKGPVKQKGFMGVLFRYRFLFSFILLGAIYTIQFFGLYPGIFAFDAPSQYLSYLNNNMSEFHPILHTVILGSIIKAISHDPYSINHGVAVFVIIQIFQCVLAFSCIVSYLFKKARNPIIFFVAIAYLGFFPPIVWEVLSVTKDTYFLINFIFAIILSLMLLDIINKPANIPQGKGNKPIVLITISIMLGLCINGMCIFRNNCIFVIPFFIIPLVFVLKKKKWLVGITATVFIITFLIYKLLFVPAYANYKPDGREMYSVPIQQLMAVYNREDGVMSDSDKEMIERLFPEEGRVYLPYIADIPKSTVDMNYYKENKKAVNEMYFRLLKENTGIYTDAFLCLGCGFWYPGFELTLYPDGTKGYWPVTCYEPAVMNSQLPFVQQYHQNIEASIFSRKWSISSYLVAPGSFFWLFLTFFGYVIEKKKFKYFPLFIFTLMYFATFLFGPVALVRYVIFLYVLLPIYLTIYSS